MEINKIIKGDCLEVMKKMPDKSVDLVLTDPPYGGILNKKSGHGSLKKSVKKYGDDDWDYKPKKEYFDEIFRISKNQIIFGGNYFIDYLYPTSCWIVWNKLNGATDFADCELAWTSLNTAVRKFDKHSGDKDRFHPTQKPLELFKWIIANYSEEGQTILDPFLGSGTTAVACKHLKRNYIGIEISEKYCKIARQRLRQETLF